MVYGASGYFGSHLVKWLQKLNLPYVAGTSRIDQRENIKQELIKIAPKYVLCPAGLKGKPNVDWFEKPENHEEGYRVNVAGRMNVVEICKELNIHCTVFTTTFIYNYDEAHPVGGNKFVESDPPNWDKLRYVRLAVELEEKLKDHPEVLNLRISLPISDDGHPGSLLTKLVKYANVESIPCSISIIDDLWPVAIDFCLRDIRGTFNFTNPGVMSLDQVLELYKEIINPAQSWKSVPPSGNRPAYHVSTDKLESLAKVPPIQEAMRNLITRWKQNSN
uniref:NAD-dependent epimerase/dehydratase domain-containing protein n=1 Tax=Arcella intermedia TaxID=1963864 RepID=A0A6B2LD98_9EUKA